jgi:rhodanese-related sulfurtransferase
VSRVDEWLEQARSGLERMTPREVHAAMASGNVLVVDTRTTQQRSEQGALPGAVVIDRTVLEWRLDPTCEHRTPEATDGRRVVVVCSQGYSSSLVAAALQRLGPPGATDMVGGFEGWKAAGLPVTASTDPPTVTLTTWDGPWPADDPDANFKADVALYSKLDPLTTLETLSRNLDIPLGALARYVLAKFATAGSGAALELGPTAIGRLGQFVDEAEAVGTEAARRAAYDGLRQYIAWLRIPFDRPDAYEQDG